MWGEEICLRQYVIESVDDVFSVGGKDLVRYTCLHTSWQSFSKQQLLYTLVWLYQLSCVLCDQRIGVLGALEMCSWFPLLPDEIWYALLFQISVEFTQGIALVKRLDFYFRKNGLQRDMERNIECQLSAAAMHCHWLVFKLNQFAIWSHIALANHWL